MTPSFDQLLAGLNPSIDPLHLALSFGCAAVLSSLMAAVYRLTSGDDYNRDIARSMILLGVLMSFVLMIVGDSVSHAFGTLGILSVIRFRAKIKTTTEASSLLSAVAVGMACGAQYYGVAIAGATFICFMQFALRLVFGAPGVAAAEEKEIKKEKKKKSKDESIIDLDDDMA